MTRIVVRLPNWVGDAIMATPMLRALRAFAPEAHIDVLGRPAIRPLVEGLPYFNAFLPLQRGVRGGVSDARELQKGRYDLALVLPHSFSSAWPPAVARISRRIGYAKYPGRRWLLTDALPVPVDAAGRFIPVPMHEMYLGLVRALGGPADADPWPELPLPEAARVRVDELMAQHGLDDGKFVVLNPGAHFGESKLWSAHGFAEVGDALATEQGLKVVVVGGPGEETMGDAVVEAMAQPAVNLYRPALDLAALYGLIARSALLITLDSGPRHMAVAARKPVVVIMGPTDPRYTNACLNQTAVVRVEDLYCLGCHYKRCPTEHECMRLLRPARVTAAALRLLAESAPAVTGPANPARP